ncbi:hypothetical protein LIER_31710 [Lithospermum erythrorhizon]|uniref:Uncharacterized protein n=1 Tax=Lithospermum erythrorhizon TaxID=34254 RepID=A0AAV3RVK2_LITER
MTLGGMSGVNVETPQNDEKTRRTRKKNNKWTTEQNLVLLSGWIKFGTDIGVNTGSDGSGTKRSRETNIGDSTSIGSISRPIGRDASKKKGKGKSSRRGKVEALEIVEEDWDEYKQFKDKEFERLDKIVLAQQEERRAYQEMKLFMKLSVKEHLDDYNKQLLEMLKVELFDN